MAKLCWQRWLALSRSLALTQNWPTHLSGIPACSRTRIFHTCSLAWVGVGESEGPSQHDLFWNTIQLRSRFPRTVQQNVQGWMVQLLGVLASNGLSVLGLLLHQVAYVGPSV